MSFLNPYWGSDFSDPAEWVTASFEGSPIDILEPEIPDRNGYRSCALDCLDVLQAIDAHVSSAPDKRIGWVAVALVFELGSVSGRTLPQIARAMGIPERRLSESVARFVEIARIDPSADRLQRLRPLGTSEARPLSVPVKY